MLTSITSRNFKKTAEERLGEIFGELVLQGGISDAEFYDSRFQRVVGVTHLPFKAPVVLELLKHSEIVRWIERVLESSDALLLQNDPLQKQCKAFMSCDGSNEIELPPEVQGTVWNILAGVICWGGSLNEKGEHWIDLRTPAPGPHFLINLLLGNRVGFPCALQTTPKSVVDRLGRGSFRSHAGTQVLATRWDMRQEENGFPANRQFYLVEEGELLFYSANPNAPNIESAFCIHSQNQTVITYRTCCGLEIIRTIFLLPQQAGLPLATEVQRLSFKNCGNTERRFRLVYTGMFGSAMPGAFQEDVLYSNIILQAKLVKNADDSIAAVSVDYHPEREHGDLRFHSMIIHQAGVTQFPGEFSTNYNEFVGNGTLETPEGLRHLSNKISRKGPGFFALAAQLELKSGTECLVDNFTGLVSAKTHPDFGPESLETEISALLERFHNPQALSRALESNQHFYQQYRQFMQLKTEDANFNAFCNYNLPFQVLYQTFVSRSFCQTQKGYREIGFREIQDIFVSMYYFIGIGKRDFVKLLLKEWGSQVFEFGYAYHNFFWTGKEPGKWSDDALWFIQALARYIYLTGDVAILDEQSVIAGTDPVRSRSIYETIQAILRYSGQISIGKHGMPLLDLADWNDCLKLDPDFINGVQKEAQYGQQIAAGGVYGEPLKSDYSESVMNAFLLKVALDETIRLAKARHDHAYQAQLENLTGKLYHNLQEYAWKEDFFARVLFNRFKNNEYRYLGAKGDGFSADPAVDGTYFLNSFSWSILSNTATESQIETMLEVVERNLKTPYGLKLVTPADLGKVSKLTATDEYFPGDRENGAVFKHASMMAVAAMFKAAKQVKDSELAGRLAQLAYWMLDLTIPANAIKNPYRICGNPRFCTQYNNSETGENIGPMLSGTSTWLTLALMAACGIEFTREGINVDPIVRPEQQQLEYQIKLCETEYHFRISKPREFCRMADGAFAIAFDGVNLNGGVIPLVADGKIHYVEVVFNSVTRQF